MPRRAFLIVLDSVGIGGAPDAAAYGDAGADTLGHIAEACAAGRGDRAGLRSGPLHLPNLVALGLGRAAESASGRLPPGLDGEPLRGLWGHARETSTGKDTPSGHWEIAGLPVPFSWTTFPERVPAFPPEFIAALIAEGGLPGVLGECHASGTEIVARLGEAHVASGKPILYTSADSVVQIAAHEESFGLERLYALCRIARRLVDPLNVGRVIARPFVGTHAEDFRRTANRKDWAVPPFAPTLLDAALAGGRTIVTLGKIGDIFAHRATGREVKGAGNAALFEHLLTEGEALPDGGLLFANFVDFDTEFGHRRDVPGYAAALEAFDRALPRFLERLRPGDVAVLTADHGCDPTWRGTDHTREQVPVLACGPDLPPGAMGGRETFADIAAALAHWLGLAWSGAGRGFLPR